jgi:hypothetical protein
MSALPSSRSSDREGVIVDAGVGVRKCDHKIDRSDILWHAHAISPLVVFGQVTLDVADHRGQITPSLAPVLNLTPLVGDGTGELRSRRIRAAA